MKRSLCIFGLLATLFAGCGGSDSSDPSSSGGGTGAGGAASGPCAGQVYKSCTQVKNGAPDTCQEIFLSGGDALLDACKAEAGAIVASTPCDHAASTGACQSGSGDLCQILWGYSTSDPITSDFCTQLGGHYVAP
jgi:hypothetical protein